MSTVDLPRTKPYKKKKDINFFPSIMQLVTAKWMMGKQGDEAKYKWYHEKPIALMSMHYDLQSDTCGVAWAFADRAPTIPVEVDLFDITDNIEKNLKYLHDEFQAVTRAVRIEPSRAHVVACFKGVGVRKITEDKLVKASKVLFASDEFFEPYERRFKERAKINLPAGDDMYFAQRALATVLYTLWYATQTSRNYDKLKEWDGK